MTKEELLARLNDIEWNDFEVKEASGGIPKSMWETVSAFSNTEGGWIILGVKEKKTSKGSKFIVNGVPNPEQMEQDIITTLRSRTKFNAPISCKAMRYNIDEIDILAFEIPLSPHRPVAIKSNGEVYIRTGSGDTLATDMEVDAIVRDASFGAKSEMEVPGSNFNDLNLDSIASYRSYLRDFNRSLSFPTLNNEEFCRKLNIVLSSGKLCYGSLLMFGKRESVLDALPNFWIDYMEVPGDSYATASQRYTYRMPEQENIWESFQLIMHRLRNFVDSPYIEGPDIFGKEDNSQLFCLREGLVNFCAHSDYFASAHPTIRVFDDRIVMQNPGRFILDADEFRSRVLSMPRNPSIIRLFRHPKLSENAGYGIDKILSWKKLTGKAVTFESDMLISTITYPLASTKDSRQRGENNGENGPKSTREKLIDLIKENPKITRASLSKKLGISSSNVQFHIERLKSDGIIERIGSPRSGQWKLLSD